MPLLRLSNGRVYTAPEDINRIVAPMQVGHFALSSEVAVKVRGFSQPLSQEDAMFILKSLVPHYVKVNDWHCVFSGAIIKGVQLSPGLQGVVYCHRAIKTSTWTCTRR